MKNKKKSHGLLLDFDGVVADTMQSHYKSWSRAFSLFNINIDEIAFYMLEGQGIETIARMLAEKYGLNEDEKRLVLVEKVRDYYKHEKIAFFPGFREFLNNIKQQKLKAVVVTGGNKDRVKPVIERHLAGYFEDIVTVDDVQNGKPHPEPYLKGAEKIDTNPESCWVIENAPLGIESAKSAGCKVIALTTTLPKTYLNNADYVVDSFVEVEKILFDNRILN